MNIKLKRRIEENIRTKNPKLDLSYLKLTGKETELALLKKCTHLNELDLSSNQLTDISALSGLGNLNELDLSSNQLTDISALSGLGNLKFLYLSHNQLTDISALSGLGNLKFLYLSHNKLTDISALSGLVNLKFLYLSHNQLTDISALSGLVNLKFLYLSHNQLTDISALSGLVNLKFLYLSHNQLTDISALSGLVNLTSLYLSHNQLTDISTLSDLVNLIFLGLANNKLTDIANLSGLINLNSLNLSSNKLSNIPDTFFNNLPQLKLLILYKNLIKNIPQEIFNKYENVLDDTRNYLQDIQKGNAANREVKIIFIGNGSVGKTQVAKCLCEQENFRFDTEHQSTHAIALLRRKLGGFQLNCWDFAGQDLYYATHRLFMQTRALFVLVWDFENEVKESHRWNGKEYPNENLRYWLEYAKCFAPESPILVVQNKIDKPNQKDLYFERRTEFQKEYPILDFLQVSAKNEKGFKVFQNRLQKYLEVNKTFKTPYLPTNWVNVRDAIRSLQSNVEHKTLSVSEFEEICNEKDCLPSASTILGYLHETGVLYYRKGYFSNQIIVNQGWAIEAIYKVLDRESEYFELLQDEKGQLNYELITKIWPNNTKQERVLFIDFMLSAELAFEIFEDEDTSSVVVPQLLPDNQSHQVAEWRKRNIEKFEQKIITYRFLPKVFIQLFIVKAHRFSNINLIWDSGIILETNKGSALIEAFYEKGKERIEIWYENIVVLNTIQQKLDYISAEGYVKAKQGKPETNEEIFAGFEALEPVQNKEMNNNNNPMENIQKPKIYISYSWKTESDNIANQLQSQLQQCGIELIRDKVNGVGYMQSISDFMQEIGRGKYILVVIGNDYLNSPNCMYELAKIAEHNNFDFEKIKSQVHIVTLDGVCIYDDIDRSKLITYWEKKMKKLNKSLSKGGSLLKRKAEIKKLEEYELILNLFDYKGISVIKQIADLNTLSTQIHQKEGFKTLITRLNEKLKADGYDGVDVSQVTFESLLPPDAPTL